MRKAVFVGALCLFGLSQSGLAAPLVIKLSRPNTSYATFLNDRNACLEASGSTVWTSAGSPSFAGITWPRYDVHAFAACMNAKGYLLDPNGYRAIRYQKSRDGREWVLPV